jgi:hypothetical protein
MFYQDDVFINIDDGVKCYKLIAVHAGLEKGIDVKEQMKNLKARDTRSPMVQALSGRKNVWDIPEVIVCFLFSYYCNTFDFVASSNSNRMANCFLVGTKCKFNHHC